MNNPSLEDLQKVAEKAVKRAEIIIMKSYKQSSNFDLKPDQSPVSKVDLEAENQIKETISKSFPTHGFWGEEYGKTNEKSDYIWIIDPIDGTKNYLRGIPLFATQLACIYRGEFIIGISNAPALQEFLIASRGKGAYLNGESIRSSRVQSLDQANLSFGNINHFYKANQLQNLVNLSLQVRQSRGIGDAWSYHLIASGRIDIMIDAKTKIWDIAALTVIIQESGGTITDFNGQAIGPNISSVICTNGPLHHEVLSFFDSTTIMS